MDLKRRQLLKHGLFLTAGSALGLLSPGCKSENFETVMPDDVTQLLLPPKPTRIIVYCHGKGEDRTAPLTDKLKAPMITAMLSKNWAILSHNAHGDNWGNATSVQDYTNAIIWARRYTNIKRVDIFSQSMGGCDGLQLLALDKTITHWLGIYPVCNLANMFTGWAKPDIEKAFAFTDELEYSRATAGHDPMLIQPELFRGKKIKMWASYSDNKVSKKENADKLRETVKAQSDISVITAYGNHGDPSHFNINEVINFFD